MLRAMVQREVAALDSTLPVYDARKAEWPRIQ